jgi:hypothetical protein
MQESFEFCDFMSTFDAQKLHPGSERVIYIPRKIYDCEVCVGQNTDTQLQTQINVDIPRTDFHVDGEEFKSYPDTLPLSLGRYCTQAVMGVPVELMSKFGIVAECSKKMPLKVEVWGNKIRAQKWLRLIKDEHDCLPLQLSVLADMKDGFVLIKVSIGNSYM